MKILLFTNTSGWPVYKGGKLVQPHETVELPFYLVQSEPTAADHTVAMESVPTDTANHITPDDEAEAALAAAVKGKKP